MHTTHLYLLRQIDIVMVKTRFPENIGMAARAGANMGAGGIVLAAPERWDFAKARPLATAKGEALLHGVRVCADMSEALAPYGLVVGTTARTGGWRRELLSPEQAAAEIWQALREGSRTAIIFGPEDRGLNNEEIERCQRLVTIPTMPDVSSLNVAQAVLLLLYECHKQATANATAAAPEHGTPGTGTPPRISATEQERLYGTLKETLLAIDFLHGDNPDYFLMPLRRFLGRSGLRRHEYDALMGVCRQVKNKIHL